MSGHRTTASSKPHRRLCSPSGVLVYAGERVSAGIRVLGGCSSNQTTTEFVSLDYYRDGHRGLSLVLTSRGTTISSINIRGGILEGWQSPADCNGLENRRAARYRGFESHPFRHYLRGSVILHGPMGTVPNGPIKTLSLRRGRVGAATGDSLNLCNPCAEKTSGSRPSQTICLGSSGVEHGAEDAGGGGSIPSPGTNRFNKYHYQIRTRQWFKNYQRQKQAS